MEVGRENWSLFYYFDRAVMGMYHKATSPSGVRDAVAHAMRLLPLRVYEETRAEVWQGGCPAVCTIGVFCGPGNRQNCNEGTT